MELDEGDERALDLFMGSRAPQTLADIIMQKIQQHTESAEARAPGEDGAAHLREGEQLMPELPPKVIEVYQVSSHLLACCSLTLTLTLTLNLTLTLTLTLTCEGEDPPLGPGVHALTAAPLQFRVSAANMEANQRSLAEALERDEGMDAPRAADAAAAVATSLSGIACWPRLVLDEGRLGL